jgi:RNA polymerase sigma factor (sigma-70 family)
VSDARGKLGALVPLRRVRGEADEMSDDALIAACAVGEAAALGALFDRHHAGVYRFLARTCSAGAGDLDDLVQTTFVELWRSAGRFGGRSSVRSFIFGIAVNVSRRYVRSEMRRRAAMRGVAEAPPARAPRPDDQTERAELLERLGRGVRALPHDLRVAFVLCEMEGMTGVEAARTLGVREGTMWRRLHDARKRLRIALDPPPDRGGTR